MGKKHFTEEQIAYALRQQEAGTPVAELTRKLGVSEQTFYRRVAPVGSLWSLPVCQAQEVFAG